MTVPVAVRPTRSTTGWVPFALVALVLVPAIAGPLRLVELSRRFQFSSRFRRRRHHGGRTFRPTAKVGPS